LSAYTRAYVPVLSAGSSAHKIFIPVIN